MSEKEKQFAEGIFWNDSREGAPSFIVGSMSFKVAEVIPFLEKHVNNAGYVNIDVKVSTQGKTYLELNTWKPEKPDSLKAIDETEAVEEVEYPEEEGVNVDDIPFN